MRKNLYKNFDINIEAFYSENYYKMNSINEKIFENENNDNTFINAYKNNFFNSNQNSIEDSSSDKLLIQKDIDDKVYFSTKMNSEKCSSEKNREQENEINKPNSNIIKRKILSQKNLML